MCEFTVFLKKEIVFRDVVYAKMEGSNLIVRDVLGAVKTLESRKIVEVDASSKRLVVA